MTKPASVGTYALLAEMPTTVASDVAIGLLRPVTTARRRALLRECGRCHTAKGKRRSAVSRP